MGLFGKKQTDDCEDLGEALAQTNSGRREVELVIGDDGELEAMTPDEAEKSGKSGCDSEQWFARRHAGAVQRGRQKLKYQI